MRKDSEYPLLAVALFITNRHGVPDYQGETARKRGLVLNFPIRPASIAATVMTGPRKYGIVLTIRGNNVTTLFVTGTDTGAGKTTVTCALSAYFSLKKGLDVGVMKPFETGVSPGQETSMRDAAWLKESSGSKDDLSLINPYALKTALAPEIAAELEHVEIDLEHLDLKYNTLAMAHGVLFVEGAGGVLVPIKRGFFFSDLMKRWDTKVLVVSRLGLGTINHTLLTCRFLKSENIPVAGVILSDTDGKHNAATRTNPQILSRYLEVPLLGIYPYSPLSSCLKEDLQGTPTAGGTLDRERLAETAEKHLDLEAIAIHFALQK
jgi:dethiobiotin synthetase